MVKKNFNTLVLISPLILRPVVEQAEKSGLEITELFPKGEWQEYQRQLHDKHTQALPAFPLRAIFDLAHKRGLKNFGLEAALLASKEYLAPSFAQLLHSSPTLYDFLFNLSNEINRHLSLFNFFELEPTTDGLFYRRNPNARFELGEQLAEIYTQLVLIELVSHYLGRDWRPSIVWFGLITLRYPLKLKTILVKRVDCFSQSPPASSL